MIPKAEPEGIAEFLENIPEELEILDQWVNWAGIWSEDKEKFSKPPMTAGGRNASSTEPGTWTTLEKSLAALGRDAIYVDNTGRRQRVTLDGVGLAGLGRTPYTGIDLDHCINPETGEIYPAARKIVDAFDSYTEITPSGDGLRIWIEADKPPIWSANKTGKTDIEVYDKGRFFTVTGCRLEATPRTIEARQDVLDAFMVEYAPPEKPKPQRAPYSGSGDYVLDLDQFLEEFGVVVLKQARDATSERAYYIVCPWAHEHTGGDTSGTKVGQYQEGGLWFKCHHGHCVDVREWEHFREELDPEAYRRVEITIGGRKLSDEEEASRKQQQAKAAWDDCENLAHQKNITAAFADTLRLAGVAGEARLLRLLYLALTSRRLDKPVSVAVKGPSSGGKSHTVERVLDAFPDEAYYALTSMSEKALIYLDEDMRHRSLVIYEAAGMAGDMQTYLMRTLLSENRIRYQTAESTSKGVKPRLLEMEGPTNLIVTTTQTRMHPENETRLLSLTVTDTRAQTKDIFRAMADEDRAPVDLEPWRQLQVWLGGQPRTAGVPYAKVLAEMVPPVAVRLRRDFGAVLQLIRSNAILHQASRQKDSKRRIVATLDDYAVVRELIADLVAEGVDATVNPTVRETVRAVDRLTKDKDEDEKYVGLKALSTELKLDKASASRRVKAAREAGYLVNLEDSKGKAAKLALGEPLPADLVILPTPEDLRAEWDRCSVATVQEGRGVGPDPDGESVAGADCNGAQHCNGSAPKDDDNAANSPHYGEASTHYDAGEGSAERNGGRGYVDSATLQHPPKEADGEQDSRATQRSAQRSDEPTPHRDPEAWEGIF
jgi:hypothetical protein